jgi:hypothetical protein
VGQQLPDSDPVSARPLHREIREVPSQRAVEAHLAFRHELHHGGRDERLGDRRKVENGLTIDRWRPGSILVAHAHSENDLATLPDPGGKTRQSMLVRKVPDDRLKSLGRARLREDRLTGARASHNAQQRPDRRPCRAPASHGEVRPNSDFD